MTENKEKNGRWSSSAPLSILLSILTALILGSYGYTVYKGDTLETRLNKEIVAVESRVTGRYSELKSDQGSSLNDIKKAIGDLNSKVDQIVLYFAKKGGTFDGK